MGVAGRFWNFMKGLFWQGQRNLEKANPEAVYEMAILKMKDQYQKMQAAVGRLAAERNRLRNKVEVKQRQLAEIQGDLDGALAEAQAGNQEAMEIGEDLVLEKEQLDAELSNLKQELAKSETLVGDYLGKLRQIESQTKAMESKKDAMIAKLQSAQARKAFADMVSGMSTTSEEAAVADMDKHIEGLAAQADIGEEMAGATREEKRRKLREAAQTRTSKSKFQAMLEARAGGGAAPGGGGAAQKAVEGKGGIG
jgi:phage shock protein A